jgi:predicted alpha-1,2-mannosidase
LKQYVDTRVGTAASITQTAGKFGKHSEEYGQTLPAVLVPHGMNFWTPQTQDTESKCIAPYYYRDSKLQGFRNSHWIVGGCTQDYGSMTLMTVWGELKTTAAQRACTFSHEKEIATPSYYSAYLEDYRTQAEMTAQSRSALFRFTYDKQGMAYLIVNPNSDEGEGYIEIDLEKREIRGYNPAHRIYQGWGEPTGFSGYFVVRFEKEPSTYGVYQDSLIYSKRKSIGKKYNIGAYIGFQVAAQEKVMVKVGSSFTDQEGASNNLDAEIPHWNFDQCRKQLERCWEKHLSKITVEGGSKDEKEKFYGALYRSSFLPRVFNDVDGRYPSFATGTPIRKMENGDYYDDFSMWDTYRALHPLLTIIDPKREGQMVQSLVEKYKQGGWLPIFPCWNSYTAAMIGDHAISVIGDACVKSIKGFDIKTAYEAMRKNAFQSPASFEDYKNGMGRRALASYLKYGYIPLEDSVREAFHTSEQVSRTLEYAYDDYVLAQVARKLGKISDYKLLVKRAKNWQNVIDKRTGYAQGKHADGTFLNADNAFGFARFITEGAPCHYTWYVPHDVQGLAEWMGGRNKFVSKLDSMFSELRYWHGNEPCHQVAYLYNYVGMPWKTQKQVCHIRNTEYVNAPGGLSGNDDAGQMSAWYVFSAMGFYPVCPGNAYYVIGSPAFEKTTIRLENGKEFVVKAHGVSSGNIYIQSATLNGRRFENSYITHNQVLEGGILEFVMGAVPNKSWAAKNENCPQPFLK